MFTTNNAVPSQEIVNDIINCVPASLADKNILFSTHEEYHLILLTLVILYIIIKYGLTI